jgi:hypothetical protein
MAAVMFFATSAFAQTNTSVDTIDNVVMTNLGQMSSKAGAVIFVDGAVKTKGTSAILHDGNLILNGNFYQEALTSAFKVDASGLGVSTGKVIFRKDYAVRKSNNYIRKITLGAGITQPSNFDRGLAYVAFPKIVIETNDTIAVSKFMGIDADSINGNGVLLLTSAVEGINVWDANLRLPKATETDVPAGKVAIERHVGAYRNTNASLLMPFASPYKNQRSGYFAGMFVRNPIIDASGYVMYPLANAKGNDGIIYPEYYVVDVYEELLVGQPYLIKVRDAYGTPDWVVDDPAGQSAVGDATIGTLLFDGQPYTLNKVPEQIVTTENLYNKVLSVPNSNKYIIVGNSYSAPISVTKLNNAITASGAGISSQMYVYEPGSANYTQFDRTNPGVSAFYADYIPSQSIFMLVHNRKGTGGTLSFGRDLVEHARITFDNASPAILPAPVAPGVTQPTSSTSITRDNLLKFRVSPTNNPLIRDVAAVFVRNDYQDGKYDMTKFYNFESGQFSLYMNDVTTPATKRLQMGVPENTVSVNMSFESVNIDAEYTITASNVDMMNTQLVLLEDKLTGYVQDLRANPVYEFHANATDAPGRFTVHFAPLDPTDNDNPFVNEVPDIYSFYSGNNIVKVNNLNVGDINSRLQIIDMQGRIIKESVVSAYPSQDVVTNLLPGVYIIRINGARQHTNKFIVK